MNMLERNKKNVVAFYDLMFNQSKPREAMERFASDTYIQHNPGLGKRVHFKRVVAEGNYVVLHCHQEWPGYKDKDWAGIDIFRVDDSGKIVEHWDVLQIVPPQSANANTMF